MKERVKMMNTVRKAFVFDFDDTLATTVAVVRVVDSVGNEVKKLTPAEFNEYKLGKENSFDFSDFNKAELIEIAKETFLIALAKEVYDENHSVYVLTARRSVISDAIEKWLDTKGIKVKTVYCVGDSAGLIAENKRKVLLTIMENYDKTYFYDDDSSNVELAKQIGVNSNKV